VLYVPMIKKATGVTAQIACSSLPVSDWRSAMVTLTEK
jgi:hypothetical protein